MKTKLRIVWNQMKLNKQEGRKESKKHGKKDSKVRNEERLQKTARKLQNEKRRV